MADIPKHARYATQALFDSALSAGSVHSGAVCFIEDTRQIWVEGVYYTLDDAEIEEKLNGYATKDELQEYLPLTGGTVTGALTVEAELQVQGKTGLQDVSAGTVSATSFKTDNVQITNNSVYVDGGNIISDDGSIDHLEVDTLTAADEVKADTVTAQGVYTDDLQVKPEDEEGLADIPYVLGLNGGSYAVKVPTSEFNKGSDTRWGTAHGAYAAYYDKDNVPRICTAKEWSTSLGTPVGTAIVAGGRSFVMSDYLGRAAWSADTGTATGQRQFYSAFYAMQDFDGEKWSEMYREAHPDDTTSAFGLCLNYEKIDKSYGMWRLPTLGEWKLVDAFAREVESVQNAIGQDIFEESDSEHWTATEYGSGMAYTYEIVDEHAADLVNKSTTRNVRAVRDWVWVDE